MIIPGHGHSKDSIIELLQILVEKAPLPDHIPDYCGKNDCPRCEYDHYKSELEMQSDGKPPLTLRQLIKALRRQDPDDKVFLDNGWAVTGLDSWRGRYTELSLESGPFEPMTVRELLKVCHAARGALFTGYKGGEFRMTLDTPVWADPSGTCDGSATMGTMSKDEGVTIIRTKHVDD